MSNKHVFLVSGVVVLITLVLLNWPRDEQHRQQLVVASWGGSFQNAQREALFKPFVEMTGIEIIEVTGPSSARIKALVDSGRADWDIALLTPADMLSLGESGYLIQINHDDEPLRGALADIDGRAISRYGIGDFFSSKVISYNTNFYSIDNHPQNWKEFWDTEQFPGPRVIDAGDWSVPPIEYALLADGVEPEDLYPLDFDRAYRSIGRIAPHVVKFSTSPVMPAQALVDGEAVLAAVTLGRIAQLKQQGAPVDFVWNQGLMEVNYWAVIRNTERYDAAMQFIEFTTRPDIQAEMAKRQSLGPSNRKAFDFLSAERSEQLPTHPANLERQVFVNAQFWAAKDETGETNSEKNAKYWSRFSLAR